MEKNLSEARVPDLVEVAKYVDFSFPLPMRKEETRNSALVNIV